MMIKAQLEKHSFVYYVASRASQSGWSLKQEKGTQGEQHISFFLEVVFGFYTARHFTHVDDGMRRLGY